jgi:HSP20 family protein
MRWTPALDVAESDAAYVVTVELPGAKRDDVTLEMNEDVLTIRGEKKSEREEKDEQRHYVERTYGSFSRSFRLPAHVDPEGIKASFRDGVLTVEIPKTEAQKPRMIDIKTA